MYEPRHSPPISRHHFVRRLLRHAALGAAVIGVSLLVGTLGFHFLAHQQVLDAFTNASMLLGGMGPVGDPASYPRWGKVFASFFALYGGLVFIILAGLIAAPVFHRLIHRFHWDESSK